MRRRGMCLALVVWMFGLVACGGEEAVDTSAEIPQITNAPTTTITPIKTEAPLASQLPSITEVPDITKAPDVTEAPVSSELPVPTEMPEITVISRSWPQVQAELEQQNLQYEGYYTPTMERLDVTVEDGRELIFLYNADAVADETNMWVDYKRGRKQEEYTLVMENDVLYGEVFDAYCSMSVTKGSEAYYQPDASLLWGEITPYSMGLTFLELSEKQLYAKHGLIFEDTFWNALFQRKDWYEPKYTTEELIEGEVYQLTDIEQENLQVLHRIQDDFNGRKEKGAKGLVPIVSGSWLDLDGDGIKEQIWFDRHMEDEDFATVTVTICSETGEVSFAEQYPGVHTACYLANMESGNDFIAVAMDGISADFRVELLQYEEGQLSNIGQIFSSAAEITIVENALVGNVESYHLQCQPVIREFLVQDEQVVEVEKDYYEYRGNTVNVLKEVPIYAERGDSEPCGLLKTGESVVILGGDLKTWVLLENVLSGEKYWIKVEWHDCYLSDGTTEYSGNVLDGLTFYG